MRNLLIALLASIPIGAGVIALTSPAAAFWPLLIPVVLGATAGGFVARSAMIAARPAPAPRCASSRRVVRGARRVEICD